MIKSVHGGKKSQKTGKSSRKSAQAAGDGGKRIGTRGTKETQALTNPHGANQYRLDPRQSLFLAYYLDPKSQSRGNATQSAILAGYEQQYAENIMNLMPEWLSAKLEEYQSSSLLAKAERNIEKFLELQTRVPAMGAFGPIFAKVEKKKKVKLKNGKIITRKSVEKVPVYVESGKLLEIQQKTSHFVAERIGKKRYAKDEDDTPKRNSIVNITQIIINPPLQTA